MENRSNDLLVGSFVLGFIFLALGFLAWLTGRDVAGDAQAYEIYLDRAVTGLQAGSPVRFLGVPVGFVTDVRIDPETMNRVRVEIEVPEDTPIRVDSEAQLEQQGLTGGVFVQISPGALDAPLLREANADAIPEIQSAPSQLSALLDAAPKLLNNLVDLSERVSSVFSDDNVGALSGAVTELQTLTAQLAKASARLEPLMAKAETLVENTNEAVVTYTELGQGINDRVGSFLDDTDASVGVIEQATVDVFQEVTVTSQSIFKTSEAARAMVEQINGVLDTNAEGLGDFTASGLYELTFLFQELRGLVSNLSLLAERIERAPSEFIFGTTSDGVVVD
ncbi:MAG: MlaD family protein [Pseudomonadota bacterium]